ncbi:MAG: EAL domain-containing protein [Firmicutes bacterium]|nr:EAL domain-containing protein [Bacillota bacterium]
MAGDARPGPVTAAVASALAAGARGLLAASLMVGAWEFSEVVLPRLWRRGRPLFAAVAASAVLAFVHAAAGMPTPWGVWAVSAVAPWLWLATGWAAAAGTAAAAGWWLTSVLPPAPTAAAWPGALALLALGAVSYAACRGAGARPGRLQAAAAGAFGLAIVAASLLSPGGAAPAAAETAVAAALVAVYAAGRGARASQWEETARQAREDALTGALTRHGLSAWLAGLGEAARREGVVLALDLDDFKWFNDTFGHALGDAVLTEVALRLRGALREGDAVARPGGDEFTVWMPATPASLAPALARRVHQAVTSLPFEAGGLSERLHLSLGWAAGPLDAATAEAADRALLRAKREGKDRVAGPEGEARPLPLPGPAPADGRRPAWWLGPAADALWRTWGEAAVLTDAQGRILSVNPAYERLTGRGAAELVGEKPGVQSARATPPGVYERMWAHLAQGRPVRVLLRNRRPDGSAWWAVEDMAAVTHRGVRVGYWAVVRDALAVPLPEGTAVEGLEAVHVEARFQPIVDPATGAILGYEALARPRVGEEELSPEEMFAAAQRAGLLREADRLCLEAAARALAAAAPWPTGLRLSLNVRLATLAEAEWLSAYLDRLPVPRSAVVLEVSEADVDPHGGRDWTEVRRLLPDVAFALDDLGSGWYDVYRLTALDPAWIKVDRSWLLAAQESPAARDLLAGVARWAHRYGVQVVAEGVETREQAELVCALGIGAAQGFWWGRPGPLPRRAGLPAR